MSERHKKYQVFQCHAPSGGVTPVDPMMYDTLEEARGAAEALMLGVSEFNYYNVHGTECVYPQFWPQPIWWDGVTRIWITSDEE